MQERSPGETAWAVLWVWYPPPTAWWAARTDDNVGDTLLGQGDRADQWQLCGGQPCLGLGWNTPGCGGGHLGQRYIRGCWPDLGLQQPGGKQRQPSVGCQGNGRDRADQRQLRGEQSTLEPGWDQLAHGARSPGAAATTGVTGSDFRPPTAWWAALMVIVWDSEVFLQEDGVIALTNGNYVVISSDWNNQGAVTWGNGTSGITGLVSISNSLVGTRRQAM